MTKTLLVTATTGKSGGYTVPHLIYPHRVFAATNGAVERVRGRRGTAVAAFVDQHRAAFDG